MARAKPLCGQHRIDSDEVVVAVADGHKGQWSGIQQTNNQAEEAENLDETQEHNKAQDVAEVHMNYLDRDRNGLTHAEKLVLVMQRNRKHGGQHPPNSRKNEQRQDSLRKVQHDGKTHEATVVAAAEAREEVLEFNWRIRCNCIKHCHVSGSQCGGQNHNRDENMQTHPQKKSTHESSSHRTHWLRSIAIHAVGASNTVTSGGVHFHSQLIHAPAGTRRAPTLDG